MSYSENDCHDYMIDNHLTELKVYKAKRITGIDDFYCREFNEIGEKGNCGNECESYKPRNGKSGCCKHNTPCYEPSKIVTLILKNNKIIEVQDV
jgi:hypothetical protein